MRKCNAEYGRLHFFYYSKYLSDKKHVKSSLCFLSLPGVISPEICAAQPQSHISHPLCVFPMCVVKPDRCNAAEI